MNAVGIVRAPTAQTGAGAALAAACDALWADLREDRLTAWVPDPLAWADLGEASALGVLDPSPAVTWMPVASIDGRTKRRPVLSPALHAALHQAVAQLRGPSEQLLRPGVCGYRTGADGDSRYSTEFLRFQEFTAGEADSSSHVVFADVAAFFTNLPLPGVLAAAESAAGGPLPELRGVFARLADAGAITLPPGYADARMLANLVLAGVDEELPVPFARWVDDYRLFLPAGMDPDQAVSDLAALLGRRGLQLNHGKTQVVKGSLAAARSRNSLTSVYHPDRGDVARDRANLRSVFFSAAADPIRNRRALRFVLRRLAAESDDVAVDWATTVLPDARWEAPRLVAYLAAFEDDPRVQSATGQLLKAAAETHDDWLITRLSPLAARGLGDDSLGALESFVSTTECPAAWGLGLRVLGCNQRADAVERQVSRLLDPRAALAALRDVGVMSDRASDAAPAAAAALTVSPAPPPLADSIL